MFEVDISMEGGKLKRGEGEGKNSIACFRIHVTQPYGIAPMENYGEQHSPLAIYCF